jgi:hypothetical protein
MMLTGGRVDVVVDLLKTPGTVERGSQLFRFQKNVFKVGTLENVFDKRPQIFFVCLLDAFQVDIVDEALGIERKQSKKVNTELKASD